MNDKFLNEAKEIELRWSKTGLLDGISDRFSRGTTAQLLEGQRLQVNWICNETGSEREIKKNRSIDEPFEPSIEQKDKV